MKEQTKHVLRAFSKSFLIFIFFMNYEIKNKIRNTFDAIMKNLIKILF